ncbi:ATP-binding cassette domain-containing protein [Micromonospora sp. KC207]|uniref:ATP-binding cassette domain-containing protein n=1 Tax=Micromonospora sp. KC207 TaxID=2530377 RepID=UPI001052DE00|nr:ATP-binding cassette domain-containing protein [Micromonospora sp. KC207]TDC58888.1 ATP-binding cassette domain-containing protein [Micromonospora sp. KC207]
MIELAHLTKRYGDRTVVDDLSFSVRPGVVTGFLGPNGAGKTTTMRMILGLATPTRGTVTTNGRRYDRLPAPMREVGALLDARAVHGSRTAADHLLCLAYSNGISRRRVGEVLEQVGLAKVAKRRIGAFSLGMSQRLGIAAALLGDPAVLMFDEPVNGLDPEGVLWIRNLMRALAAGGRTVLVSSHLMSEMALTADHLIIIGRGRLIVDKPTETFMRSQGTQSVLVRTPDAVRFARQLTEAGAHVGAGSDGALEVTGMDSLAIGNLARDAGVALAELTPQRNSLEEAFMELTRDSVEYSAAPDRTERDLIA